MWNQLVECSRYYVEVILQVGVIKSSAWDNWSLGNMYESWGCYYNKVYNTKTIFKQIPYHLQTVTGVHSKAGLICLYELALLMFLTIEENEVLSNRWLFIPSYTYVLTFTFITAILMKYMYFVYRVSFCSILMPPETNNWGHDVLGQTFSLSVCQYQFVYICPSPKSNLACSLWSNESTVLIISMHITWVTHFQMTSNWQTCCYFDLSSMVPNPCQGHGI